MSGDRLDDELKKIAEQVKSYPKGSRLRSKWMTRLLHAIQQSGKLYPIQNISSVRAEFRAEVRHDAINEALLYVARNIDDYNPHRAKMMAWVNCKLNFSRLDAINHYNQQQPKHVFLYGEFSCLEGKFRNMGNTRQVASLSVQLMKLIEEDPDNIFNKKHIRGHAEISFRAIALKILSGYSKREIAANWNIPEQTLYSFFSRACHSFRSEIEAYLKEGTGILDNKEIDSECTYLELR